MMPGLLLKSRPWVRSVFGHAWAPMQALAAQMRLLPPPLLVHMLGSDRGYVAVVVAESRYEPGPMELWGKRVNNVGYVSVQDLARGTEQPLHVVGHLIDHLLGCDGRPSEPWLTGGGGISPNLREAGQRLPSLYALGYGIDKVARDSIRDYFAQSLALYCLDRQALNVGDPQITKWFRSTLWSEAFWRGMETDVGN